MCDTTFRPFLRGQYRVAALNIFLVYSPLCISRRVLEDYKQRRLPFSYDFVRTKLIFLLVSKQNACEILLPSPLLPLVVAIVYVCCLPPAAHIRQRQKGRNVSCFQEPQCPCTLSKVHHDTPGGNAFQYKLSSHRKYPALL